jgi:hypothetical protein
MSDFQNHRTPKARKEHKCEWCGEPIPKGEVHYQFTGIWQGDWQNWRMHDGCHEIASLNNELDDGFYPYEHERHYALKTCVGTAANTCTDTKS